MKNGKENVPKLSTNDKVRVNLLLTKETNELLNIVANELKLNRSQTVNHIIRHYVIAKEVSEKLSQDVINNFLEEGKNR